jgi:farnesyl-diphosphate farnesyltransferase
MAPSTPELLTTLLREVSRSFYLTMRVLPSAIRPQIGLAYLLARTADTIADTELVPLTQRLDALRSLRERILGLHHEPLHLGAIVRRPTSASEPKLLKHCESALQDIEFDKLTDPKKVRSQGSVAEQALLDRSEEILGLLARFSSSDQQLVRRVLATITSGQELDLQRFAEAGQRVIALQTDEELDDYTYRVAGCVGEFWTQMARAHLFPDDPLDAARLLANGIRFGKGLQLVNVLRDLPADLRQGRCYVPARPLAARGMTPADLLHAANEPRFRPLYQTYLAQAESHLTAGWEYTNTVPRRWWRVRLACAWPILIGIKTLAKLRTQNVLDGQQRLKITRAEVRKLMLRSIVSHPWPAAWERLFARVKAG